MPEESTDKVEYDNNMESLVRAWEFKGDETLHHVWAVERLTEDDWRKAQQGAFNLTCEGKALSAATVGASGGGSMPITFIVVVPFMTNAVDANKWEELFLTKKKRAQRETNRKDL